MPKPWRPRQAAIARYPEHLHIILIIGKGNERWFKDHGKHIPYEGDDRIVERVFRLK